MKNQNYISIVKMFVKDEIKGTIEIRGESKVLWNTKEIKLDQEFKTLKMQRKSSQNDHELFLSQYKAKWTGQILGLGRAIFELVLIDQRVKTDFKDVYLGDQNIQNARQWFDLIKVFCNSFEDEEQEKRNRLQKRHTVIGNERTQSLMQEALSNFLTTDKQKNQQQPDLKPNSLSPTNEKQLQQPSKSPTTEQSSKEEILLNQNKTRTQIQQVSQQQTPLQNQNDVFVDKLQYTQPHRKDQQKVIPKAIKKRQKEIKLSASPLINQIILDNLATKENLVSDFMYRPIYIKKNLTIMEHQDNPLNLKVFLEIQRADVTQIIQCIINPEEQLKWNFSLDSASRTLIVLPEQSTLFLYEKRKKFGNLYLPRDFVIMRYLLKQENDFFIIEKSINHEEFASSSLQTIRGQIHWGVWGIVTDQYQNNIYIINKRDTNKTNVIYSVHQTNNGYLTTTQNSLLTKSYMIQLRNLEKYLYKLSLQQAPKYIPSYISNVLEKQQHEDRIAEEQENLLEDDKAITNESTPFEESKQMDGQKQQIATDETQLLQNQNAVEEEGPLQILLKKNSESQTQYLERLMREVEFGKSLWSSALHYFETDSIEVPQELYYTTPDGHHFIFKDEWALENGAMRFIHKKKMELQKDIITFLLKSIGSNLLSGKSVMSISLPVYIFEKRSNLERHAFQMGFAPVFLEKAAKLTDPIKQMHEVMKFGLATSLLYMNMEKPFNPILGETYQGRLNGSPIYCEQISHHPPICSFLLMGRGYKLHGHLEVQALMSPNTVIGLSVGYFQIDFYETKNSITIIPPSGYIKGLTFGDRIFFIDGVSVYVDPQNKLIGELFMSPNTGYFQTRTTPLDNVDGKICKVNDQEIEKFKKERYLKYQGTKGGKFEKVSSITGCYTQRLFFDNEEGLNWDRDFPYTLKYEINPLASDSIYREDLIAWKLDDQVLAQEKKEKLEIIQRNDRKFREKLGPKKKKH